MSETKEAGTRTREFEFNDKDFQTIVKIVKERTGIKLADHKKDMVYGRLARRLRELGIKSFKNYLEFLDGSSGDDEVGNFVNAITTNLTRFFRESHHFDDLKEKIINKASQGQSKIRIWSAGCSSGAEPYSIAMTVCEALPNIAAFDVKILATDIDTNMLETSKNGIYPEKVLQDIPQEYARKYVSKYKGEGEPSVIMSDKLKKLITFNRLNLLESWPMKGPFDIIFCRNVVIYFDKDTQRVLFSRYADLLKDDATLYIGHSESLFGVSEQFEIVGRTIYKKVK